MNKKLVLPLLAVLLVGNGAQAQGLSGLLGGKKEEPAKKEGGDGVGLAVAAAMDPDAVLAEGGRIIIFTTTATILAMSAAEQMLGAFPPEKVAAIKEKFAKFNELNAKHKEGEALDSSQNTLVSDAFAEMAKLDPKGHQKEKAKVVRPAYTKLGLAVLADGLAMTQLPGFLKNGQATLKSMSSNPMQLGKAKKILGMLGTLGIIAKNTPEQLKAFQTVRTLAKTIAAAEKFKLGEAKLDSLDINKLNEQAASRPDEG